MGDPVIQQKWELPPIRPLICEYRLLRLRYPGCGKLVLVGLPAGVSGSAFGPKLEAHIATLAGVFRLSRRQVAEVVREMFQIEILHGRCGRHDHADERHPRGPVGAFARGDPPGRSHPR